MEELKKQKIELRKRLILQRNSILQNNIKNAGIKFTENFLRNSKLVEAIVSAKNPIAIYHPSKKELSPLKLSEALNKRYNARFCLPVVVQKHSELKFVEWNLKDGGLRSGKFYKNILEPKWKGSEKFITPEVLIIPLVGFDERCKRLGMGGGFYDRTIANLRKQNPKILTIGIAYELQRVPKIPSEENDEILDFIVTESSVYTKR